MTAIAVTCSTDTPNFFDDMLLVQLAREIAMDIHDVETIVKNHALTLEQFAFIEKSAIFQTYLKQYIAEWNSCASTADRVKLKSLAFVEEALPEFFAQVHRQGEPLPGKVKALEVISKIGGLGPASFKDGGPAGEKFSITINMGADEKMVINASPTPKAIGTDDQ